MSSTMEELRKKVATMLRAALQSCKEGVPLSALPSDYRKMTGELIPFRDLGYSNLMEMLIDMTHVLRVGRNKMGQDAAFAIADQSTAHIQSLISRQKTSKPRPMPIHKQSRRYPHRPSTFRTRPASTNAWGNYVKPRTPITTHHRPSYENNFLQRVPTSPTPAPPPPVTTAPSHPRSRPSSYVVPPRFLRKKDDFSRSDSPPVPPKVPSPEFYRPSFKTSSFDDASVATSYESKRKHSPVRARTPPRTFSFEDKSFASNKPKRPSSPEPTKTVTFDPSSLVYYEPGITKTITYQHPGIEAPSSRSVSFKSFVSREARSPSPPSPPSPVAPIPIVSQNSVRRDTAVTSARSNTAVTVNSVRKNTAVKVKRGTGKETSRQLIDEFARYHGEQPIYRSLPVKTKKMGIAYVSTLILLNTRYLSYPDEKPTAEEAEEVAASKAVKALNIIPGQYESAPVQTPAETALQINVLVDRLYEIIKEKPNGIWHTKVPNFYEEIYQESLPKDWLEILKQNCSDLCINNTVDENFILYPNTSRPRSPGLQATSPSARVGEPKPLDLPEGNDWDVFVTNISEPLTIAIRLVDYSDDYDQLVKSMEDYYFRFQHPVKDVVVGEVYGVKSEDSWYRVRVLNILKDKVECYYLDNGDTETLDAMGLNVLMPQFFSLPYLAIQCQLAGLEEYVQNSAVYQKVFDLAFGRTLVATVVNREDPLTLHLFDTSTEEDVDINEILIEVGNHYAMTPQLPEEKGITQGYLTHVTDEGDLFIQVQGSSLNILEDLTTDIAALCEDRKGQVSKPSLTKMYCAKFTNGLWYRAYVRNVLPDNPNMMTVWYVDYGNTAVIPVSDICEVDSVSDFLAVFPHQALRCRLYDVPSNHQSQQWTKEASAFLRELVPDGHDHPLLIKVAKQATETSLPQVDLFQRIQPSQELMSVNQTLMMKPGLFDFPRIIRSNHPVVRPAELEPLPSNASKSKTLQEIPDVALSAHMFETSQRILPSEPAVPVDSNQDTLPPLLPPQVPHVGQNFDVTVTSAAHPHNFTVQPWSSSVFLDDLMDEMQHFYNSEDNICDMHECLLKEGEFYASKSKDGHWYRTSVIRRMADEVDTVWVYFVDYGDYDWMTLNDLQPLWKRFRSLPFQAIRASLADVVPIEGDWDPMDCVNFQKMIVEKQFVSIIKTKMDDRSHHLGGYELGLTMIDTSSERDVYIHDLLVEKGKAKLVNA